VCDYNKKSKYHIHLGKTGVAGKNIKTARMYKPPLAASYNLLPCTLAPRGHGRRTNRQPEVRLANRRKKMKKRVLMGLVLLVISGTSAIFAQQPTLDKLNIRKGGDGNYMATALNKNISGAVVIPDTYDGKPVNRIYVNGFSNCTGITSVIIPNSVTVIENDAFHGCTGIKSITIPASVTIIGYNAFRNCTNLTSVTFLSTGIRLTKNNANFTIAQIEFDGDLGNKYQAGGAGTYTRTAGSNEWTKQGGRTLTGTGTYSDGAQVTITGDGQTITVTGTASGGGKFTETYKRQ